MARRVLQLAAGLILLVGLLGLSTALIAEVREEVIRESRQSEDVPARQVRERSSGLPVQNLTLLDPTTTEAPDRELVDDGLRFTGPGQLQLDPGERVRPGRVPLPADATVTVGPGSQLTGERITCPNGCRLSTEGRTLALPVNSSLIPPGSTDRLAVDGSLEEGDEIELPSGTQASLPTVRFPSGTRLDVKAGALAQIPEAAQGFSPALGASTVVLPPGTVVHRATNASTDTGDLQEFLNRSRAEDPEAERSIQPQPPDIRVTRVPESIEKGEPFRVVGLVLGPEGNRLADHRVTVYANATKQRAGFEIQDHVVTTDASGVYTARSTIPETKATRPYHIVARAHADETHDPPIATGWSDPVVNVTGSTTIELQLPKQAGVRVPLPLEARLTDAFSAPVPNQTVAFEVEGVGDTVTARTGDDGVARGILEGGLPFTGNYTVNARFPGTENLEGSSTSDTLEAIEARIDTNATVRAPRGSAVPVSGTVVSDQGDPGRVQVSATYNGNLTARTPTTRQGQFTLDLPVPPWIDPGNHTVQLEAPAVDASHRLVLTATAGITIQTPNLGPQPVGSRAPIPVTVRADNGTPVSGIPIEATTDGTRVARAVSTSQGKAPIQVPVPQQGTQTITLTAPPTRAFRPAETEISFPAGPLDVDARLRAPPGGTANSTLDLSVARQGLAHTPVQVVAPGIIGQARTDEDGRARFQLSAPAQAQPGRVEANLSLPAYGIERSVPLTVLDQPQLDVRVLEAGRDGDPVRLSVEATGARGPIAGLPVRALASGAFEDATRSVTAPDGTAELTLTRPDDAEGVVSIRVEAPPTQDTAEAVHVASTEVTPAPPPWGWILGAVSAVGLAGAAALRRRNRPSRDPAVVDPEGPTISMAIEPQGSGLPPVWHPGESTTLHVQLTDADGNPLPRREVRVNGPPGHRRLTLDRNGRAQLELPAHARGTAEYHARFEGDGEHDATEAVLELRIVNYREEIDREYRELRDTAYRSGLVGSDATPRELARQLDGPAEELVGIFERCDYSPRPVDRDHYERFMQAKEAVDPHGAD